MDSAGDPNDSIEGEYVIVASAAGSSAAALHAAVPPPPAPAPSQQLLPYHPPPSPRQQQQLQVHGPLYVVHTLPFPSLLVPPAVQLPPAHPPAGSGGTLGAPPAKARLLISDHLDR